MAMLLAAGLAFSIPKAAAQDATSEKPPDSFPTIAPQMSTPSEVKMAPAGLPAITSRDSPSFAGHISDFVDDQKQIWTSPLRVRLSDATWLVPLGGLAAGLFVTDRQYSASLPQNPATISHYKTVSNYGVASLLGAGAGLYLFSFPMHNEHWRETGFLAGEAAVNTLLATEALKYSFRRERPYQDNGSGAFFQGGTSFPSEHAAGFATSTRHRRSAAWKDRIRASRVSGSLSDPTGTPPWI